MPKGKAWQIQSLNMKPNDFNSSAVMGPCPTWWIGNQRPAVAKRPLSRRQQGFVSAGMPRDPPWCEKGRGEKSQALAGDMGGNAHTLGNEGTQVRETGITPHHQSRSWGLVMNGWQAAWELRWALLAAGALPGEVQCTTLLLLNQTLCSVKSFMKHFRFWHTWILWWP